MAESERLELLDRGAVLKPRRFPMGLTTCRALVLATLLAPGEFDTAGMFPPGAISLHVVMRALARRYRWPIVRLDASTATGWATTYSLPPGSSRPLIIAGASGFKVYALHMWRDCCLADATTFTADPIRACGAGVKQVNLMQSRRGAA